MIGHAVRANIMINIMIRPSALSAPRYMRAAAMRNIMIGRPSRANIMIKVVIRPCAPNELDAKYYDRLSRACKYYDQHYDQALHAK